MKFYQEITTDWLGDIPNHTYLLNDSRDRMLGYVASNTNRLQLFKAPVTFDGRRRKFKAVPNTWGWIPPKESNTNPTVTITGSRGDLYKVERTDGRLRCSCSGYKFRGQCKHVTEVERTKQI